MVEVVVYEPDGSRKVLLSKAASLGTATMAGVAAATPVFLLLSFVVGIVLGVLVDQGVITEAAYAGSVLPLGLVVLAATLAGGVWAGRKVYSWLQEAAREAGKMRP